MKKLVLSLIAAGVSLTATANAASIIFKGDGVTLPTSVVNNTPCSPLDICGTSLGYSVDGFNLDVTATANGVGDQLVVQDINPANSGLGVYSEAGQGVYNASIRSLDEVDAAAAETLVLTFDRAVRITDLEFNNGSDEDCPVVGIEGGCGSFELFIDGVSFATIVAESLITDVFEGTVFELVALDTSSFHLASLDVSEVPLPAAALFMGTGLVAFARRRAKKA